MLAARARSVRGPYRDRLRAKIVLAAAAGQASAAIARELGVCTDTVPQVRRRFAAWPPGLRDAPRSGRPPVFTAADRAEVIALACALPRVRGAAVEVERPGPGPRTIRPLPARGLGVHDRPVAGSLSNFLCKLGRSLSFCYLLRVISGAGQTGTRLPNATANAFIAAFQP